MAPLHGGVPSNRTHMDGCTTLTSSLSRNYMKLGLRHPHAVRAVRVAAGKKEAGKEVGYGRDWYKETKDPYQGRTVRQELEYRRQANLLANNGKERKDLYTDNWDGSEYKGSAFNILTFLVALFILVPVAGLVFAFATFGTIWG